MKKEKPGFATQRAMGEGTKKAVTESPQPFYQFGMNYLLNHNLELTLEFVHIRTSPNELSLVPHLTTTFLPLMM